MHVTHEHAPMSARQGAAMMTYALTLAGAYPAATADALADKLLTIWQGSDRALRLDVAQQALATVTQAAA